jgi:hypothetical protein
MFKLDNITQGTWKPHFFDEDCFGRMFKLDNITRGIWKPHFFDEDKFVEMFKLYLVLFRSLHMKFLLKAGISGRM